jgi:hypothetical protein
MITPLEIIERIDAHTVASEAEPPRKYLGASQIGTKCVRRLFYDFRWCGGEKFDGRMLRLFARGNREEVEMVKLLRGIGLDVHTPNEGNKKDFQFFDLSQHFSGTCDGVVSTDVIGNGAELEYAILEGKTYATERFKKLKQTGVKESDPIYFSQLQVYMGELKLSWAMFFAVCKETDEIFIQWVPFDQTHFEVCLNKAELVINSESPPPKYSTDPQSFTCRYCPHNQICHANIPLAQNLQNCRNCIHGHPAAEGSWVCGVGQNFGTLCDRYQFAG